MPEEVATGVSTAPSSGGDLGTTASSSDAAPPDTTPGGESQSQDYGTPNPAWESYDWEEWDGKGESLRDAVGSKYVGLADRISEWHQNDYSGRRGELDRLKQLYSAMLDGSEDPRVSELETELKGLRGEQLKSQKEAQDWPGKYEQLQGQFSQFMDDQARAYADRFWSEHDNIKSDEALRGRFSELLTPEGPHGGEWDAYVAAELLTLSDRSFQSAVEAKKEGAPDKTALKLAKAEELVAKAHDAMRARDKEEKAALEEKAKQAASQPRPAAQITQGADRSTIPRTAIPSPQDTNDLDERRRLAARRALRLHEGGRR